ncbi:hypothetical protein RJ55_00761 [Drechmeria coniospora]|nr:hypothetical protein RJ55_00761 [Drechmeria coniospora]
MARTSLLLSLAVAPLAALAHRACDDAVPRAYMLELKRDCPPHVLDEAIGEIGTIRLNLVSDIYTGVSFQVDDVPDADERADGLAKHPCVQAMSPVCRFKVVKSTRRRPRTDPTSDRAKWKRHASANVTEDTFEPHVMTQVDRLRALGYTGTGVRIAVIDSGIDFTHPDLGGCYGGTCLVSFGADLAGDYGNGTNPDAPSLPMDGTGHGTHVAGIVAGQPNELGFSGVAPGAKLGAYRTEGLDGQAEDDFLTAAYLRAYNDKVDVIVTSISIIGGWPHHIFATTIQSIVEKGVPCVVSAGNDGDIGYFNSHSPATAKGAMSVATFISIANTTLEHKAKYVVDDGGAVVGFNYKPAEPSAWGKTRLGLYTASTNTTDHPHDACGALPESTPDLANKIVLIHPGNCSYTTQAKNLAALGAKYLIFYDANLERINLYGIDGIRAGAQVSPDVAQAWIDAIKDGKAVTLDMETDLRLTTIRNSTIDGALNYWTNLGPTFEMGITPSFGAPGGSIISTYPKSYSEGYKVFSGTSMSTPHVGGIVALIGQIRGTFDPALINGLLTSTAKPQLFHDGNKFYGFYAPVAQQGAGLVQAYDAAFATTLLEPASLAFNDTDHYIKSRKVTVRNTGDKEVTYNISHVPAMTVYVLDKGAIQPAPFPSTRVKREATFRFSRDTITLGPGQEASFDVEPTPPSGVNAKRLALWSGWIKINGTDGSALSVPYQGLVGSLHNATVMLPNKTWMARAKDYTFAVADSFTLPKQGEKLQDEAGLPSLVTNLTFGTPNLTAHVVPITDDQNNGTTENWRSTNIGQMHSFPLEYLSRYLRAVTWYGKLDSGDYAPNGTYKIIVRALRIFGDVTNEAHWETSETPPFKITYEG